MKSVIATSVVLQMGIKVDRIIRAVEVALFVISLTAIGYIFIGLYGV